MHTSAPHHTAHPLPVLLSECVTDWVASDRRNMRVWRQPCEWEWISEPMENHVCKTQAWLSSPVTAKLGGRDRQIPRTPWTVSLVRMLSFRFTKTPCLRENEAEKTREKSAKSCSDLHMHRHQCVCTRMCPVHSFAYSMRAYTLHTPTFSLRTGRGIREKTYLFSVPGLKAETKALADHGFSEGSRGQNHA